MAVLSIVAAGAAFGQPAPGDAMDGMKMDAPSKAPASPNRTAMPMTHDGGGMAGHRLLRMGMSSSVDLLDPMSQEASGTAWLPSATPVYGKMIMRNGDMFMVHGDVHVRYTRVGSRRGDRRVDAPNWFMGMYSHPLGSQAQLGIRAMLSLDPLTEGGFGYPLLFQTGETWRNKPLHDRQHPHDLFDEISATYSRRVGKSDSAYLYLGYPGEPALGPPTYMHRLIAYDLADAPIGHHWQDATHITFGVATAGFNLKSRLKFEGSVFNGREPNENRYNFDRARFDSQSGRISYNPDPNDAFQVSYGSIHNPEGDGVSQRRATASWIYNRPLGDDANFSSTLVWGRNRTASEGSSDSYLAEADYQRGRNTLFSRLEEIWKSGRELVIPAGDPARKYGLGEYTVGCVHDLKHGGGIDTGIGASLTLNTKPSSLDPFYGRGTPLSFEVFFRLRPSRMGGGGTMNGMAMGESMSPKPPPMHETNPDATGIRLTATMSPDRPRAQGKNRLIVKVTDSQGRPIAGATVRAAVSMTSMDMGTEHPPFQDMGDGTYAGDVVFAMAGPWQVALTVTVPGGRAPIIRRLTFDVAAGGG